ncbi:membrane protein insertase, YidC/Oxa1 family [Rickettsiales bacterium Ac37b]|nr:membrane protein insertase, YidC/Oxa1 family [Rickettsiales bacterium Ac37b]
MSDLKKLSLAIILSTLVLVLWQYYYELPKIEQHKEVNKKTSVIDTNNNVSSAITENILQSREQALSSTRHNRVTIDNSRLHGSIDLHGARLDDITLAEYKESLDPNSNEVVLLSPPATKESYFAEFGWVSSDPNLKLPNSKTIWESDNKLLTVSNPLTLSWNNGEGLLFTITVSIDNYYMFNIKQQVENYSEKPIVISAYSLINKPMPTDHKSNSILHEGPIGVFNGILSESTYDDLFSDKQKEFMHNKTGDWLGITSKYWLTALIPNIQDNFTAHFHAFTKGGQNKIQVDYISQPYIVQPNQSIEIGSHFFTGAKKLKLLDQYEKSLHINLFDRAIDFGWFYFITKPMFYALQYFYSFVGNFGIAILLLTVVVKLIMFPLANKSYHSMNKMKQLQPYINKLKEKCGNDRMKFNKEVMDLYKREGVNPLSGCLPILIQIPVFFSLYKVLFVTLEMRQAPFFGWIHDLSMPDPTSFFNLFGLIPWSPPGILHVGIWPIIMGITMYLQQRMNPEPTDPVQARVMKFLPVIFTFMFGSLPAGLIIYWAWNNVLSIVQQFAINIKKS